MTIARWLPRFRRATRAMEVLRDREQWSRADIQALQLDRLNTLWQHAAAHVPYYAKLAEEQRLPRRFASLEEFSRRMPLLAKSKIKENPKAFLSDHAGHGHWKYTGGSTGTPTTAYWSHDAHRESLAAKYRFQASWGIDIFDRTTFLWGRGAAIVPGLRGRWNRFRQPYIDRLRNRQRLAAYDMSRAALRRDLKEIGDFAPRMMYGYSRALYLLAMEAQQPDSGGFHAPSLKLVVATSEPAWPNMIDTMQRAFGAPVAREYGAAECGIMATDAPDRTLRVREDHVLIETLPREDGHYDIVVTVLTNPSFPLIRYAIGDITDAPLSSPERGFAILNSVGGRNNDLLRSKTGDHLHWVHVEDAVATTAASVLRRFSFHQRADGSVTINAELYDPTAIAEAAPQLEAMRCFFAECLGGYPVKVEIVDRVSQTISGKHRVVYSDLYDLNTTPAEAAASSI